MNILGIDIGGTGIKGAVVDTLTGELVTERLRIPTPKPATPEAVAETVKALIDRLHYTGPVGCGFPARIYDGKVRIAANIDKSWIDVKVEDLFSRATGEQVFVANDADVAGLCELKLGSGKNEKGNVLFLTIGTGIGSALFVNGSLYANTELGHVELNGKDAETQCAGSVKEAKGLKWKEWGVLFNRYLRYLEFILAPDMIILGGGGSKKFDKYKERLTISTPIKPAAFLNVAGIIGAALYCEQRLNDGKSGSVKPAGTPADAVKD